MGWRLGHFQNGPSDDPRLYRPLDRDHDCCVVAGLVWPVFLSGQYSIATAIGVLCALAGDCTAVDFVKKTSNYGGIRQTFARVERGSVCGSLT